MPEITYRWRSIGADAVIRDEDRIAAAQKRRRQSSRGSSVGGGGGASGRGLTPEQRQAKESERAAKAEQRAVDQRLSYERRQKDAFHREQSRAQQRLAKAEQASIAQRLDYERKQRRDHMVAQSREQSKLARTHARELEQAHSAIRARAGGIAGSIGRAGIAAGGIALAAGSAVVGAAARDRMAQHDKAVALSVQSRGAGETQASPDALLKFASQTAAGVKGTRAGDILDAQAKFVTLTGDLEGAMANSKTMAIAARASGGSESDVAATMASLRDKFGIRDSGQMTEAIARLHGQGKAGSMELSDFARYAPEMAAAGSRFGLDKGVSGVETLGGLAQLARKSVGSGAEASTGVSAMLRQLVAKGGTGKESIKALTGADVFTDKSRTTTRNVKDVLVDVVAGAKGDQTKLTKIFGDEGMKGASALIEAFNDGAKGAGKNATEQERVAAGAANLRKVLDDTTNAGGAAADMYQDAAAASSTASATLTSAWDAVVSSVGEPLLGPLSKLAGETSSLTAVMVPLANAAGDVIDAFSGMIKYLIDKKIIDPPKKDKPAGGATPIAARNENREKQARLLEKKKQNGGLSPEDSSQLSKLKLEEVALNEAANTTELGARKTGTGIAAMAVGGIGGFAATVAGSTAQSTLDPSLWDPEIMKKADEEKAAKMMAGRGRAAGSAGQSPEDTYSRLVRDGKLDGKSDELFRDPLEVIGVRAGRGKSLGGAESSKEGSDALVAAARALEQAAQAQQQAAKQYSTQVVKGG